MGFCVLVGGNKAVKTISSLFIYSREFRKLHVQNDPIKDHIPHRKSRDFYPVDLGQVL